MSHKIDTEGIEVSGAVTDDFSQILTPEALSFVGTLAREFESRRKKDLARDKDGHLVFLAESSWALKMAQDNHPKVEFHFTWTEFHLFTSVTQVKAREQTELECG